MQSVAERFRQSTLMPEEREFESSCSAARPSPRVNGESSAHWPLSVETLALKKGASGVCQDRLSVKPLT